MGKARRVFYFVSGVVMLVLCVVLISDPKEGYLPIIYLLELSLILEGIRKLVYYFTMARYMVGGLSVFYKGLFFLDAGLFTITLDDGPRIYAMIYLLAGLALSGCIDLLQANSARRLRAGHWRYQMFYGIGQIAIAGVGLFFLDSVSMLTWIFAAGLLHSAVSRMIMAFRRTAIVYVE